MNTTKNVYCRLCAELKPHTELTNMQTDEEMCQKVVNKLSRFNIMLDFQENILPKTVCLICVKSLEQAFVFVTAVEQAQTFLSDINLVEIREGTTFYVPSDVKVENSPDPMDVNDNDDEEFNNEDVCDVQNDDVNNLSSENIYSENKATRQNSCFIAEEKIGAKHETDENCDTSSIKYDESLNFSNDCRDNQFKDAKLSSVSEEKYTQDTLITKHNYEPNPPLHNSADCMNRLNDINVDTNPVSSTYTTLTHGKEQVICKQISHKQMDTTVYSEDYINKQINRLSTVPVQYLKKTWMDYEWKCSHCGTLFSNIEELQNHSLLYHNICNAYQCADCKIKKQRLNAFIKHVRSHRKYLHYSCYKCYEKFPKMMETRHHKMKIHENSKHVCLGCNTPFSTKTELEDHVNKYYNILWTPKTFNKGADLTCSTCKKLCANITALRKHLNTHKEKKRDRVCDRCGKCFDSESSLRTHMDTHIEKVLYHCEVCKTTFKSIYSLRYHASIHSGIKPFTCDVCSKCFRTKSQITNHMKFHSDYFPITCTVCNKKFRTDYNLQNHMLQHTGEKPYSCDICPRDFTNLANRNKHMRRRHGIETGKKRQAIIKLQTTHDSATSDLATAETKFVDLDKMNEWKNKIMEHRKNQRANNNLKNEILINKECNGN